MRDLSSGAVALKTMFCTVTLSPAVIDVLGIEIPPVTCVLPPLGSSLR